MLLPDSPRYSEAYPRLSVGEALRHWQTGKPAHLFRNHLHHAVGLAMVEWRQPEIMAVSLHFQSSSYFDEYRGEAEFRIIYKGSTQNNARPYVVCDGCSRHIDVVIFADEVWRCKTCLRLGNRSTLIDPVVRMSEELYGIECEIGDGRPRHMSMKRFQSLEDRHRILLSQLGKRPRRTASSDFRHRIDGKWLPHSEFVATFAERQR